MIKEDNIEAAKALVEKYNSITVKDIFSFERTDEPFKGKILMSKLTGFGNTHTCSLCQTVDNKCDNCIYTNITNRICSNGINRPTYVAISWAMSPTKLIEAIRNRADYIQALLTELSTKRVH